MRITTNAILRNYRSNLGTSLANLDSARNKVMTGRQFISSAENPSGALRAATLERKYVKNLDYISTVENTQSYLDSQENSAMQISDLALTLSKQYGLESLNATNSSPDSRKTFADAWRGAQESMLLSLNASYEGKYVFGGANAGEPPFALSTDANGKQILTYRGVNVNPDPNDPDYDETMATLKELSQEDVFLDLGFGLKIDEDGNVDPSSAFNTSLPGINLVGFGKTENGTTKNMILLAGEIADCLEKEPFEQSEFENLLSTFEDGRNTVLEQVTTLGTKSQFLTSTKDRLETDKLNLATQLDNVVNIDMADAITQYSWAQYAYNAALKVGTNILSPSFIDFMN